VYYLIKGNDAAIFLSKFFYNRILLLQIERIIFPQRFFTVTLA